MQLHSGKSIDQIPAGAGGALLILGLAAYQPALGVLFGTCVLAAQCGRLGARAEPSDTSSQPEPLGGS